MLIAYLAIVVLLSALVMLLTLRLWHHRREMVHLRTQFKLLQDAHDQLVSHAYFDHLTGLANRSLLEDRFQLAVERAKRSQIPFALIMIDLDKFKEINDDLGHLVGDQILVAVSRRLVESVRASDTVARFGGDEFVLIVESLEYGMQFGNIGIKLIDALSENVTLASGTVISVGASLGYAVYPGDGLTMSELLGVADKAMYDCKSSGMMPLF